MQRQIITAGNLPRWYVPGAAHFVTYRLAGTIPIEVHERLRVKNELLLNRPPQPGCDPGEHRIRAHKQLFVEYDKYLDEHRQIDWLRLPAIADVIRENLYHHNGAKYQLFSYCIMPNHVHVLLQPIVVDEAAAQRRSKAASSTELCGEQPDSGSPLSSIMHSLKSYTANKANALLKRTGAFWQHESYDHWIRDEDELERVIMYIDGNPIKAGLVQNAQDWLYGSAHDRFLIDGSSVGYLGDVLLSAKQAASSTLM